MVPDVQLEVTSYILSFYPELRISSSFVLQEVFRVRPSERKHGGISIRVQCPVGIDVLSDLLVSQPSFSN